MAKLRLARHYIIPPEPIHRTEICCDFDPLTMNGMIDVETMDAHTAVSRDIIKPGEKNAVAFVTRTSYGDEFSSNETYRICLVSTSTIASPGHTRWENPFHVPMAA